MAATLDRFGRLDVVLVNVGVVTVGSVERGDPHAFERVIKVNLIGAWQTVRAVLPHVIAAQGYILFVSSIAGTVQGPLHATYNSSKAGLQALANTLRLEVQGLGIVFITWDEGEGRDGPIGMIILSSDAKGGGYSNTIHYTHSSTLRTLEEILGVSPLLGDAAYASDLSDLFKTFP